MIQLYLSIKHKCCNILCLLYNNCYPIGSDVIRLGGCCLQTNIYLKLENVIFKRIIYQIRIGPDIRTQRLCSVHRQDIYRAL